MKNDDIKKLLNNTVKEKRVLHSYMFLGSKFSAKLELAIEFAKEALCLEENAPCNNCKSCLEMENNNHPDFLMIDLEAGENTIKIEQIRKLQEEVIKKPIVSEKKVFIINNSDKMTVGAQNCLLKTLEEPPQYIMIILLAENENLILNTIKSRCTKITCIEENKIELTEEQKDRYNELEKVFSNINKYKLLDVLNKIDVLYKNEKDIMENLDFINIILSKDLINNKKNIKYIEAVEETKKRIKANANFTMSIDNLLYNIWKN